jgi:hypothetical protein
LSFGQVAWRDDEEVPVIQGRHLTDVETLGKSDHAGIDGLKTQGRVGREEF